MCAHLCEADVLVQGLARHTRHRVVRQELSELRQEEDLARGGRFDSSARQWRPCDLRLIAIPCETCLHNLQKTYARPHTLTWWQGSLPGSPKRVGRRTAVARPSRAASLFRGRRSVASTTSSRTRATAASGTTRSITQNLGATRR